MVNFTLTLSLLKVLELSKSSYYYAVKSLSKEDKDFELKVKLLIFSIKIRSLMGIEGLLEN